MFALYESSLRPYIAQAFGWHAEEQAKRFEASYPSEEIYLVMRGQVVAGYVALRQLEGRVHLALLLLSPAHCGQGIGQQVMSLVEQAAAKSGRGVSLSCFKSNARALSFYRALGYREVKEDEFFVEFDRQPPNPSVKGTGLRPAPYVER